MDSSWKTKLRSRFVNLCACSAIACLTSLTHAELPQAKTAVSNAPAAGVSKAAAAPAISAKELPGSYSPDGIFLARACLQLHPDRSFLFWEASCACQRIPIKGTWGLEGDVLILQPAQSNQRTHPEKMNLRFIPVKWGARLYLVIENQMPGFCVTVRPGKLLPPPEGFPATRIPDSWDLPKADLCSMEFVKQNRKELPPVKGNPLIPVRYQQFYEQGEVRAKVVEIDAAGNAILDTGSEDRLQPGWLLVNNGHGELKIITVEPHRAIAKISYYWNAGWRVKVGDVVTTGEYLTRPRGSGYERFEQPPALKDAQAFLEAAVKAAFP